MGRPIELLIHIDAMRHNLLAIRRRAPLARIWAVAKADAYGCGIASAVRGFEAADGLAVLDLKEAALARELGWQKPILMMEGAFCPADLEVMHELGLSCVIHQPEQVQMMDVAKKFPADLWIKVNAGMNRLGFGRRFSADEMLEMAQKLQAKTGRPLNWMMHFANADTKEAWSSEAQEFKARYAALTRLALARSIKSASGSARTPSLASSSGFDANQIAGDLSMANSAATLSLDETHAGWVRPGIALYGATPYAQPTQGQTAEAFGLRPVQTLLSQIIAIQHISAGESVGYGSRFRAARSSRIGVVAAGYADGYPRNARDGMPVWIEGMRVPIAGRVSMDMITVDLTDHPKAGIGSKAELWGPSIAVDEIANACGTIGYELMTKVTPRVVRVPVGA